MRCKWCYTSGHNKRTCSSYRDHLKKMADGGSSIHANKLEKLTQKRQVKCSFCDDFGHNTKGCSVKKEFDVLLPQKEDMERRVVRQHLTSLGYGKGAVIEGNIVIGYQLTSYHHVGDENQWSISEVHLRVMSPDGKTSPKWSGNIPFCPVVNKGNYTWGWGARYNEPSYPGNVPSYVPTDLQQIIHLTHSTFIHLTHSTLRKCSKEGVESMKEYIKEGQNFLQKMVG